MAFITVGTWEICAILKTCTFTKKASHSCTCSSWVLEQFCKEENFLLLFRKFVRYDFPIWIQHLFKFVRS